MNKTFLYTFVFAFTAVSGTFYAVDKQYRQSTDYYFQTNQPDPNLANPLAVRDPSSFPLESTAPGLDHYDYDFANKLYQSALFNEQRLALSESQLRNLDGGLAQPALANSSPTTSLRRPTIPTDNFIQDRRNLQYSLWMVNSQRMHNFNLAFLQISASFNNAKYRRQWYQNRRLELIEQIQKNEAHKEQLRAKSLLGSIDDRRIDAKITSYKSRIAIIEQKIVVEKKQEEELFAKLNDIQGRTASLSPNPFAIYGHPNLALTTGLNHVEPTDPNINYDIGDIENPLSVVQ